MQNINYERQALCFDLTGLNGHFEQVQTTKRPRTEAPAALNNPAFSTVNAGDITQALADLRNGNRHAASNLMTVAYGTLRRMAAHQLAHERAGHTLLPSDLVQETYLKIINVDGRQCRNRAAFYKTASRAMRRILVDHARKRNSKKRGCDPEMVQIDQALLPSPERPEQFLVLDAALDRLAEIDPTVAQIVELRFFGGLTTVETAEVMGFSASKVKMDWLHAKDWLCGQMEKASEQPARP